MEEQLKKLGLELPKVAVPVANYVPWVRVGNVLHLAGALPVLNGEVVYSGKVGREQSVESGYEAARLCALNAMAVVKQAVGSLDKVKRWVFVNGFVNAVEDFEEASGVMNGVTDLLGEVFGESGKVARAAVAVSGLPKGATVEIQCIVEVE